MQLQSKSSGPFMYRKQHFLPILDCKGIGLNPRSLTGSFRRMRWFHPSTQDYIYSMCSQGVWESWFMIEFGILVDPSIHTSVCCLDLYFYIQNVPVPVVSGSFLTSAPYTWLNGGNGKEGARTTPTRSLINETFYFGSRGGEDKISGSIFINQLAEPTKHTTDSPFYKQGQNMLEQQ